MDKITILLLFIASIGFSLELDTPKVRKSIPEDIRAYGTINFGDGKQFVETKLNDNDIFWDNDRDAYMLHLFDVPFVIEFVYGTNNLRPTFLKTIRLKLGSIIDSHIITKIIETFDIRFGMGEKFYIDMGTDSKEYYRWNNGDKAIHLDFDGLNIDIVVNSSHFNSLARKSTQKESQKNHKKKEERIEGQIKKLF
tara:strand:+ start:58 stop:642 length:585 start_codon:yes stop_codon:yes gene_type:complete